MQYLILQFFNRKLIFNKDVVQNIIKNRIKISLIQHKSFDLRNEITI
jgi:hypothetical protein